MALIKMKRKIEKIKEEEGLGKIIEITDTMTSMTVRNLIDGLHLEVLARPCLRKRLFSSIILTIRTRGFHKVN